MTTCKLDGHILLVQISANIILVLSETSVIFSEAETCSNLEREEKKENKSQHFLNVSKAPSENDILSNTAFFLCDDKSEIHTGLSMYKTEYLAVQA